MALGSRFINSFGVALEPDFKLRLGLGAEASSYLWLTWPFFKRFDALLRPSSANFKVSLKSFGPPPPLSMSSALLEIFFSFFFFFFLFFNEDWMGFSGFMGHSGHYFPFIQLVFKEIPCQISSVTAGESRALERNANTD